MRARHLPSLTLALFPPQGSGLQQHEAMEEEEEEEKQEAKEEATAAAGTSASASAQPTQQVILLGADLGARALCTAFVAVLTIIGAATKAEAVARVRAAMEENTPEAETSFRQFSPRTYSLSLSGGLHAGLTRLRRRISSLNSQRSILRNQGLHGAVAILRTTKYGLSRRGQETLDAAARGGDGEVARKARQAVRRRIAKKKAALKKAEARQRRRSRQKVAHWWRGTTRAVVGTVDVGHVGILSKAVLQKPQPAAGGGRRRFNLPSQSKGTISNASVIGCPGRMERACRELARAFIVREGDGRKRFASGPAESSSVAGAHESYTSQACARCTACVDIQGSVSGQHASPPRGTTPHSPASPDSARSLCFAALYVG